MKTVSQSFITIITVFLLGVSSLFSNNSLTCAGKNLPVLFGKETSSELTNFILNDMNMLLAHFKEVHKVSAPDREFSVSDANIISNTRLRFTGKGRFFPKQFKNDFGRIISHSGQDSICLTSELISSYEEAYDFIQAHSVEYANLALFINFMNDISNKSLSYSEVQDLFYFDESAKTIEQKLIDDYSNVANAYGTFQYRMPSVLEFRDGNDVSNELAGKIVADIYIFSEDEKLEPGFLAIYDEGKWKIYITILGT